MTGETMLDLSAGSRLVLDGVEWTVEAFEPQYARVLLRRLDGTRLPTSVRFLVNHPRRQQSSGLAAPPAANRDRQPKVLQDLPAHRQQQVHLRMAHLLEVETGYRSGDPLHPKSGEPRPEYDPAVTTLTQRRAAKVSELRAMRDRDPQHARMLALQHVSLRTLIRMEGKRRRFRSIGCADDRWLRVAGARPSITEPIREAILAVRLETLHRSRIGMRARERLIHQYVREKFGPDVVVPCYETLRGLWIEWFGPGGARQRYTRSAAAAARVASGEHVVVHRPGQVVALDTTVLPVKVRETVFGHPVSVHLTLALDAYTHSLVAFRLTLVSDTSVDVAMLLRDVMMPLPLRDGWGEDMEWRTRASPRRSWRSSPGTGWRRCRSSRRRRSPPTTARCTATITSSRCNE